MDSIKSNAHTDERPQKLYERLKQQRNKRKLKDVVTEIDGECKYEGDKDGDTTFELKCILLLIEGH